MCTVATSEKLLIFSSSISLKHFLEASMAEAHLLTLYKILLLVPRQLSLSSVAESIVTDY